MKPLLLNIIGILSLAIFTTCTVKLPHENNSISENLKGKVKSCTSYYYEEYKVGSAIDSNYSYKIIETFTDRGNILSEFIAERSQKKSRLNFAFTNYFYDNKERTVKAKDESGKTLSTSIYILNKDKSFTEIYSVGSHNRVIIKIIYNYKRLRDTMYNFDEAGKFISKTVISTTKNGI